MTTLDEFSSKLEAAIEERVRATLIHPDRFGAGRVASGPQFEDSVVAHGVVQFGIWGATEVRNASVVVTGEELLAAGDNLDDLITAKAQAVADKLCEGIIAELRAAHAVERKAA